jgi:quercetin dioxygenase-like cupin family protein
MNPPSPSVPARVGHAGPGGYVRALPGILRKTPVHGQHTLLAEFKLAQGAVVPLHQHPQEQTGYLVSGHLVLTIAGIDHDVRPGDSWMIPGGMEHGARVPEDSVAVEVFSPVRADYLP